MKPLPKTVKELEREWRKKNDDSRKTALGYSYEAFQIGRRSLHRGCILLVGPSGAGKSTTVNHLFGKELCKTSFISSETRSTTEWICQGNDLSLGIESLTLSIVDSPGFRDTDGLEQDACNLHSIQQFFRTHPENYGMEIVPNMIFFVFSCTDNRMIGANSILEQSFRALKKLNLVDVQKPNVVIVLTHASSLGIGAAWKRKIAEKMKLVKDQASLHLEVVPEIVALENKPEDFELPEIGVWTELPDKTVQPLNLYQAVLRQLKRTGDKVTHAALNLCFNSDTNATLVPRVGHSTQASSARNGLNSNERSLHTLLTEDVFTLSKTEVQGMIQTYIKTNPGPEVENTGRILSLALYNRDFKNCNQIMSLTLGELAVKLKPYQMNSVAERIATDVFGIKPAKMPKSVLRLGEGFNLLLDKFSGQQVLVYGDAGSSHSGAGISIPSEVDLMQCNQTNIKMQTIATDEEYVKTRLQELGVKLSANVKYGAFSMEMSGGYNRNLSTSKTKEKSEQQTTFLLEKRMFQISLDRSKARLSDRFKEDVRNLPGAYNKGDQDCVTRLKSFFQAWGHHVVIEAYGGGSVVGKFIASIDTSSENYQDRLNQELHVKVGFLTSSAELSQHYKDETSESGTISNQLSMASLVWSGGDMKLHKHSLQLVTPIIWSEWEESLKFHPTILSSSLKLLAISEIVKDVEDVGLSKSSIVAMALEDLFGDSLEYQPPPTRAEGIENPPNTSSCFPSTAIVITKNAPGGVRITDLKAGDEVLSISYDGKPAYTTFYTWFHKAPSESCEYVEIHCNSEILRISPHHLMFRAHQPRPVPAKSITIDDTVHVWNSALKTITTKQVTEIKRVILNGKMCPATLNGRIVVNGFAVSCYSDIPSISFGKQIHIHSHLLSHIGVAPLRMAYRLHLRWLKDAIDERTGIHEYCLFLMKRFLPAFQYLSLKN